MRVITKDGNGGNYEEGHGGYDSHYVASISDVTLVILTTMSRQQGVVNLVCFPTIAASRPFVAGREYGAGRQWAFAAVRSSWIVHAVPTSAGLTGLG